MILPVLALDTGYMSTIIVIIVTGIFSYYSCYLCVSHVGNEPDLDTAIYKHFGKSQKMKALYDICVWSSLLLIDFLYFELITIQWIGLAPPHQFTLANAVFNAFALFAITLAMKYFQFGANLMAYGIISIICYLLFLTWVVASEQTTGSHPEWKAFGSGIVELAAGMGQAFAIQTFFIPIIKMSQRPKDGKKLVLISYVIGGIAYTFISFMGSYGNFVTKKESYIEIIQVIVKVKKQLKDTLEQVHGK